VHEYQADLIRVVDGDTMHLDLDLGLDIRTHIVVRVYGVNAPELKTPEGKSALAWSTDWFAAHSGPYTVSTIKDRREKYGRYLATLTAPDGHSYHCDLLDAGHAVAYLPS